MAQVRKLVDLMEQAGIDNPFDDMDIDSMRMFSAGADQRLRGTPLTLGGNLNIVPGYRTQLEADRAIVQSEKNVLDALTCVECGR